MLVDIGVNFDILSMKEVLTLRWHSQPKTSHIGNGIFQRTGRFQGFSLSEREKEFFVGFDGCKQYQQ